MPQSRLSLEEVLRRVKAAGFELIEPCTDTRTRSKIKVRCLNIGCTNTSAPTIGNISRVKEPGCESCKKRLPEDEFHRRLKKAQLKANYADYKDKDTPIECACLICGETVYPRIGNISSQGAKCYWCGIAKVAESQTLSNEQIDEMLKELRLRRTGSHKANQKVAVKCLICNKSDDPFPLTTLRRKLRDKVPGCRKCARKVRDDRRRNDPNVIDAHYESCNLLPLEPYSTSSSGRKTRCLICRYEWPTRWDELKRKTGEDCCPHCIGSVVLFEDYENLAKSFGGRLIEMADRANLQSKWKCVHGHLFAKSYTGINSRGRFCTICNKGWAEMITVSAAEQLFSRAFIKQRISVKGTRGGLLELDGYSKPLKLAIEHNGLQHYKPVQFGNMPKREAKQKFRAQVKNDEKKVAWCEENEISLIIIRQLGTQTPLENLKGEIKRQSLEKNVKIPVDFDDTELVFNEKYMKPEAINKWNQMHQMAKVAGYDIISNTYAGTHANYDVKCQRNGHQTSKNGRKILLGRKCTECRGRDVTIEAMKSKQLSHYPSVSAAARAIEITIPEAWWSINTGKPRNGYKLYFAH